MVQLSYLSHICSLCKKDFPCLHIKRVHFGKHISIHLFHALQALLSNEYTSDSCSRLSATMITEKYRLCRMQGNTFKLTLSAINLGVLPRTWPYWTYCVVCVRLLIVKHISSLSPVAATPSVNPTTKDYLGISSTSIPRWNYSPSVLCSLLPTSLFPSITKPKFNRLAEPG